MAAAVATPVARQIDSTQRTVTLGKALFRVGGTAAEGPLAFGRLNGGVIDARGRVWVADALAHHIVRVGPDRSSVNVLGRFGQGPMEFAQLEIAGWSRGRVVAFDRGRNRLTLIDPAADTGRVVPVKPMWNGRILFDVVGVGPEGATVFIPNPARRTGPGFDPAEAGWATFPPIQVVVRDGMDSAAVILSEPQPASRYFDGHDYLMTPFITEIREAMFADTVALVGTLGGDVLVSDLSGAHPIALDVGEAPGVQVSKDVADHVRRSIQQMPEKQRRQYVSMTTAEKDGLPRLPFFDRVVMATNGAIWVRHTAEALMGISLWEVLTPEGGHLATVRLPAKEDVLAVGSGRVATVGDDENDVAVLSVYRNPVPRRVDAKTR